jgi:hypothetical protein
MFSKTSILGIFSQHPIVLNRILHTLLFQCKRDRLLHHHLMDFSSKSFKPYFAKLDTRNLNVTIKFVTINRKDDRNDFQPDQHSPGHEIWMANA